MASSATACRHVVAVPYPGRGHINPMLAVCRLLVAADDALTVTVVVTEEWHALLASAPTLPDRVRFATIPNDVIPPEGRRGVDHAAFFEAVSVKMAEAVERLLDRLVLELEPRPEGIVVDTYLTWGVAVGARCRMPVCSLWTQPATFFLALYHLDLWPSGDDHEHDEGADEAHKRNKRHMMFCCIQTFADVWTGKHACLWFSTCASSHVL